MDRSSPWPPGRATRRDVDAVAASARPISTAAPAANEQHGYESDDNGGRDAGHVPDRRTSSGTEYGGSGDAAQRHEDSRYAEQAPSSV
jgi:hypothetical protein